MNVLAPLMGVLILLILLVIVVIIPLIFIIYLRMRYCVCDYIYIYVCSVWMVNVAGCVTGCPFYNQIAGCITKRLVDQPISTYWDRLYNRVGI